MIWQSPIFLWFWLFSLDFPLNKTITTKLFYIYVSESNCADPGNIHTPPKEGVWLDSPTPLEIPVSFQSLEVWEVNGHFLETTQFY